MYLLNWNPEQRTFEASLGGFVSPAEAQVFADNLISLIGESGESEYDVCIDYSSTRRLDEEAIAVLDMLRDSIVFAQARQVLYITPDEYETERWTDMRLQAVLEGHERYMTRQAA